MPFKSINREEFNAFHPPHLILEVLVKEQIEWLANDAENVIGTLAGTTAIGWKYAVLQRDARGHFRIFKLGGNSYSRESAWAQFLAELEAAETVGPAPASSGKPHSRVA
jgi:hypothetical protein